MASSLGETVPRSEPREHLLQNGENLSRPLLGRKGIKVFAVRDFPEGYENFAMRANGCPNKTEVASVKASNVAQPQHPGDLIENPNSNQATELMTIETEPRCSETERGFAKETAGSSNKTGFVDARTSAEAAVDTLVKNVSQAGYVNRPSSSQKLPPISPKNEGNASLSLLRHRRIRVFAVRDFPEVCGDFAKKPNQSAEKVAMRSMKPSKTAAQAQGDEIMEHLVHDSNPKPQNAGNAAVLRETGIPPTETNQVIAESERTEAESVKALDKEPTGLAKSFHKKDFPDARRGYEIPNVMEDVAQSDTMDTLLSSRKLRVFESPSWPKDEQEVIPPAEANQVTGKFEPKEAEPPRALHKESTGLIEGFHKKNYPDKRRGYELLNVKEDVAQSNDMNMSSNSQKLRIFESPTWPKDEPLEQVTENNKAENFMSRHRRSKVHAIRDFPDAFRFCTHKSSRSPQRDNMISGTCVRAIAQPHCHEFLEDILHDKKPEPQILLGATNWQETNELMMESEPTIERESLKKLDIKTTVLSKISHEKDFPKTRRNVGPRFHNVNENVAWHLPGNSQKHFTPTLSLSPKQTLPTDFISKRRAFCTRDFPPNCGTHNAPKKQDSDQFMYHITDTRVENAEEVTQEAKGSIGKFEGALSNKYGNRVGRKFSEDSCGWMSKKLKLRKTAETTPNLKHVKALEGKPHKRSLIFEPDLVPPTFLRGRKKRFEGASKKMKHEKGVGDEKDTNATFSIRSSGRERPKTSVQPQGRVIVQALMAAPNCPWRQRQRFPKTLQSSGTTQGIIKKY